MPLLVTPFAASAALLFLSPHSEASRPRVLCGGIVISAVVGVAVTEMVHPPAIAAPIASPSTSGLTYESPNNSVNTARM